MLKGPTLVAMATKFEIKSAISEPMKTEVNHLDFCRF